MNTLPTVTVQEMQIMARAMAASKLFGIDNENQALSLMLIAQAEGLPPAIAARDYNIIQGRPALRSDAMLARFQQAGGKVEWQELSDTRACATFYHPQGGTVTIDWDMNRAKAAGLGTKDMWKKYPRNMLRARAVSEGVRTVYPAATSGMYVEEEVRDFDTKPRDMGKADVIEDVKPIITMTPEQFNARKWLSDIRKKIELSETGEELYNLMDYHKSTIDQSLSDEQRKWLTDIYTAKLSSINPVVIEPYEPSVLAAG